MLRVSSFTSHTLCHWDVGPGEVGDGQDRQYKLEKKNPETCRHDQRVQSADVEYALLLVRWNPELTLILIIVILDDRFSAKQTRKSHHVRVTDHFIIDLETSLIFTNKKLVPLANHNTSST